MTAHAHKDLPGLRLKLLTVTGRRTKMVELRDPVTGTGHTVRVARRRRGSFAYRVLHTRPLIFGDAITAHGAVLEAARALEARLGAVAAVTRRAPEPKRKTGVAR